MRSQFGGDKQNAAALNLKKLQVARGVFHKIHMALCWGILGMPLTFLLFRGDAAFCLDPPFGGLLVCKPCYGGITNSE